MILRLGQEGLRVLMHWQVRFESPPWIAPKRRSGDTMLKGVLARLRWAEFQVDSQQELQ